MASHTMHCGRLEGHPTHQWGSFFGTCCPGHEVVDGRSQCGGMGCTVHNPDQRRGGWMQTFTGRAFWPLDARPEEVDSTDVAHALAHLCRYGGHVNEFYSVAEHCVLMSHSVPPADALAALLHDATEAYMVDVPRPVKREFPAYGIAESRLWRVIAARYAVDETLPASVHDADNRILLDERAALLSPPPRPWGQDLEQLQPLGVAVRCWPPLTAELRYRERLNELLEARA